jgi:uncharacterized membrane protein YozB (DUF420 family)
MHIFPENAPAAANAVLLFELAMGLALVAGATLARRRHYRAHAACQSLVIILNLGVIVWFMLPSFHTSVFPGIPGHLGKSYYWLATAHGILGLAAELLGLYILLAAGTRLLPKTLRLARYKPWMRAALALWWLVLILGLATYTCWYGPRR